MAEDVRVLLLEGEPDRAARIFSALSAGGFAVVPHVVDGSRESLQATSESPDVIFVDLRSPGLTVSQTLAIRDEYGVVAPLIAITDDGPEVGLRCVEEGAEDYVSWGDLARLPLVLRHVLDSAAHRRQLDAAGENLRLADARYRALSEEVPVGHCVTTPEGRIVSCNAMFARMFGYESVEEVLRQNATSMYMEPRTRADWLGLVAEKRRLPPAEQKLRRTDGSTLYVLEASQGIFDATGSLVEIHGYVVDITERKEAEALRDQLASALQQGAEAVTITGPDGTIRWVNPSFEKMTGFTREEVIGANPRISNSGEHNPSFFKDLWTTIARGNIWTGLITNRRKDGTLYKADTTISSVRGPDGTVGGYLAFQKDVSRELALEQHLNEVQKVETLAQIVGGVAHDFNNLLTVIDVNAELLLDSVPATDRERRDLAKEVLQSARSGRNLIARLMPLGRHDALNLEERNLWQVVEELHPVLRRLIPEDIVIRVTVEQPAPLVRIDVPALERILMNLATNARDAMPEGGTLLIDGRKVRIDRDDVALHRWAAPGQYAAIAVSDSGTGMSEEVQQHVFEPFFTTKAPGVGTGLGMAVIYGLMKSHRGLVTVYSEEGLGTTVKLFFPIKADAVARDERRRTVRPAIPTGSETILVVEDEEALRHAAQRALGRLGYRVIVAGDGEDGARVFKRNRDEIDLVMTDLVMPVLGGTDLLQIIRDEGSTIPVLITSGHTREASDFDDGAVAFLGKPWTVQELAVGVRTALDGAGGHPATSKVL